jgi:uncharacterized protein (TIGR00288 family)
VSSPTARIAMLIDGDNAQPANTRGILQILSRYGEVNVRRLYGDFSQGNMPRWSDAIIQNNLQPIHFFNNTSGKNATDINLIVDAMDLLHLGNLDAFCLVSSDSDFTKLALRIRQSKRFVIGVGEWQTPNSFRQACDVFLLTSQLLALLPENVQNFELKSSNGADFTIERLLALPSPLKPANKNPRKPFTPRPSAKPAPKPASKAPAQKAKPLHISKDPSTFIPLLKQAFATIGTEWVALITLGNTLHKLDSSYSPSKYGSATLSKLLLRFPHIVEFDKDTKQVRLKPKP